MTTEGRTGAVKAAGDRTWTEAGAALLDELAGLVRQRGRAIGNDAEVEAVHDMRTATRRLRTAIELYGRGAAKRDRRAVEKALRRVARRLGTVRDMDVLLAELPGEDDAQADGVAALRDSWEKERAGAARRLRAEIGRRRFRRALKGARKLAPSQPRATVPRVRDRAPALIWAALGDVLAYELDAATAQPERIHKLRIAAKKLRYTLEAFGDALEPGARLIDQVTAVQDAGGEMHDAIVARDRARTALHGNGIRSPDRGAIEAFAAAQDRRAESQRPIVARSLAAIRSRAFRASLGRALANMGQVTPET